MSRYAAELLGTYALVFAGTGAIVVNEQTGALGHFGVAATFGLIVLAMIYAFGDISGAHLNPAVTLGFVVAKRFPLSQVAPYVSAQLGGAFLASLTLRFLFPESVTLGATLPAGSDMQSFILELLLTYFLMLVILQVAHGSKETGLMAGIAIGAVVGLEALFAGPICGASMNPARSIAPAVVSGELKSLWLYIVAPVLGALAATGTWHWLRRTPAA
ncbi:MAG: aquaporin [Flavobacteriales bacterium]|jgi:aquaporin Z|nr:aquaporin [Flavobacteriales bacterium]MBK7940462.1 aquaporin [Flavobacteriales bacterium]MBK9699379.1 aquaporin [Flavobacteriales bacterium]